MPSPPRTGSGARPRTCGRGASTGAGRAGSGRSGGAAAARAFGGASAFDDVSLALLHAAAPPPRREHPSDQRQLRRVPRLSDLMKRSRSSPNERMAMPSSGGVCESSAAAPRIRVPPGVRCDTFGRSRPGGETSRARAKVARMPNPDINLFALPQNFAMESRAQDGYIVPIPLWARGRCGRNQRQLYYWRRSWGRRAEPRAHRPCPAAGGTETTRSAPGPIQAVGSAACPTRRARPPASAR